MTDPVIRGNSLYTIVDGPTWAEAEANSVKLGGHLVTVNDATENEWLKTNLEWKLPLNISYGAYSTDKLLAYWIGLNDSKDEGNYIWSSGEQFSYTGPNWDRFPTSWEDWLTLVSRVS